MIGKVLPISYSLGCTRRVLSGVRRNTYGDQDMSWKSPKIVEIALGAEINSYACAEAKK
jgi:coenzyme PQQ precursor peptide PqqA